MKLGIVVGHHYKVECFDKFGKHKWVEEFDNIVVTAGRNKYLDATLKTGLAAPEWWVGLKDTGAVDPTDTMASHAGWAELDVHTGDRQVWTPGAVAAGSVDNSAAKAVFPITVADTIYGAFLCDAVSGSGAGVTLLGAGDFAVPRAVEIGDVLNVTVTATMATA